MWCCTTMPGACPPTRVTRRHATPPAGPSAHRPAGWPDFPPPCRLARLHTAAAALWLTGGTPEHVAMCSASSPPVPGLAFSRRRCLAWALCRWFCHGDGVKGGLYYRAAEAQLATLAQVRGRARTHGGAPQSNQGRACWAVHQQRHHPASVLVCRPSPTPRCTATTMHSITTCHHPRCGMRRGRSCRRPSRHSRFAGAGIFSRGRMPTPSMLRFASAQRAIRWHVGHFMTFGGCLSGVV